MEMIEIPFCMREKHYYFLGEQRRARENAKTVRQNWPIVELFMTIFGKEIGGNLLFSIFLFFFVWFFCCCFFFFFFFLVFWLEFSHSWVEEGEGRGKRKEKKRKEKKRKEKKRKEKKKRRRERRKENRDGRVMDSPSSIYDCVGVMCDINA